MREDSASAKGRSASATGARNRLCLQRPKSPSNKAGPDKVPDRNERSSTLAVCRGCPVLVSKQHHEAGRLPPQITRQPGCCHPGRGRACGSQKDLATAGVRDKHAARDFGSNGFNGCYSVSSPRSSFIVGNTYAAAAADPPPSPKALQAQSRGRDRATNGAPRSRPHAATATPS